MSGMTMHQIELLPNRWIRRDPRKPMVVVAWVIEDVNDGLSLAESNLNALHNWPPLKTAKALRDAAFKIESMTIKSTLNGDPDRST